MKPWIALIAFAALVAARAALAPPAHSPSTPGAAARIEQALRTKRDVWGEGSCRRAGRADL